MIAELEDEIVDFPAIAEETQASSHVNLFLGRYYKIANKAEILTWKHDPVSPELLLAQSTRTFVRS